MDIKKKIAKNTVANYVAQFWFLIIGFILMPFIVHHIGINAFGIWILVSAITGYFGLLDLGVGISLVKYVAEYHAKEDSEKINESINTTFFIFLGMGLIASTGLFIFGKFFITSVFNIPPDLFWEAKTITYIVAATTLVGFPLRIFGSTLEGLQRYEITALVRISVSTFNAILIIIFLSMGYGIVTLVLINSSTSFIGWVLTIYYTKKVLPFVRIKFSYLHKSMLRTLLGFSSVMFIMSICSVLIYETDRVVIGIFLTVGTITYYEATLRMHALVRQVHGLMGSAIMPAASELDATNKNASMQELLLKGSKYTVAVVLPVTIALLIMAKPFLVYWMGPDFGSVALVAQVFIFYWLVNANTGIPGAILVGTNKIRLILWYTISVTIANLILSIILVQKIGLIGVVLGTTIPYIICFPIFMYFVFKILNVNWKLYFKDVVLKTYPIAGLVAIILYFATILHVPQNLIEVGIYGLFTFGIYLALFYIFGLDESEKGTITQQIKERLTLLMK